jgi:hypothetical protein
MKGLHHHTTLLVTPLLSGLHSFLFTYSRLDAHFRPLLMSIPSHVHHIYKINHKAPIRSQTYSQTARLNHYFYPPIFSLLPCLFLLLLFLLHPLIRPSLPCTSCKLPHRQDIPSIQRIHQLPPSPPCTQQHRKSVQGVRD